jgi:hypothetical protein
MIRHSRGRIRPPANAAKRSCQATPAGRLVLGFEARDKPGIIPKLDGRAIDQLLCPDDRIVVRLAGEPRDRTKCPSLPTV